MYKRHALGEPDRAGGPAGVFAFFVLCAAVVWLVPIGVEAIGGLPPEIFLMPPSWRGEIMCGMPGGTDRDHTYLYRDGMCFIQCKTPGCPREGQTSPANDDAAIQANVRASRSGLDIYAVYVLVFTILKYGTAVAALAGLALLLGRPAWAWSCVPCFAAAGAAVLEPALLWAALPAWAAAYCTDVWSTMRFGEAGVARRETNPVIRYAVRRCGRRGFALHAVLYCMVLAGASVLLWAAGPVPWDAVLGTLAFGLAGGHAWAAAGNARVFAEEKGWPRR